MRLTRLRIAVLAPLLAVAGCGGGDAAETSAIATETSPRGATTAVTVTSPEATANPRPVATGRPRFDVELTGASRSAQPGQRWSYVVRATRRGKPTPGIAKMRVFSDGVLVDTMGFFAFEGELRRTHVFPRILSGKRVIVQAEVEGEGGTRRANWPVTVG